MVFGLYFVAGGMSRQVNPATPKIFQAYFYALVEPIQRRVQGQLQACDKSRIMGVVGTRGEHQKSFFSRLQIGSQQFTLSYQAFERKDKLVICVPTLILRQ